MKKYLITNTYYVYHSVVVEAQDEKEALEKAWRYRPTLCHECSWKCIEIGDPVYDLKPEITQLEE